MGQNGQNGDLRLAIIAPHASAKFGGESILPLHYFRFLRKREIQVWMVLHSRTREELSQLLGEDIERVHFVEDTRFDIMCNYLQEKFGKIGRFTFGIILRLVTQLRQKRVLKKLVAQEKINLVHEPAPVSPKIPSIIFNVGVPVIIGPMNGGMDFPPPFKQLESLRVRGFVTIARKFSYLVNILLPGKRCADVLLVANQRTRSALPIPNHPKVLELVENGVDTGSFSHFGKSTSGSKNVIRFVYLGRLVDWKAVDVLIDTLTLIDLKSLPAAFELHIIGDGPKRAALEAQARRLQLDDHIHFHGFKPQIECAEFLATSDALVLPSLYECGGAVVLEAMSMGIPVIATDWGGPSDYLNHECGILIDPTVSVDHFKLKLSEAIHLLATQPELRSKLGDAGRQRLLEHFTWEKKIDAITQIYLSTLQEYNEQSLLEN